MMLVPPWATSRSEATPRAGLAVTPLLPSEPPQLVPRMILSAGSCVRLHVVDARQQLGDGLHAGLDRLADAAAFLDGQHQRLLALEPLSWISPWSLDQVDGLAGLAAEADEDVGGDVGMLGEAGQRAVELVVVGAVVLHGAAGLVRDGHHAVDVGILLAADRCARKRSEMYLLVLAEQLTVLMMAM